MVLESDMGYSKYCAGHLRVGVLVFLVSCVSLPAVVGAENLFISGDAVIHEAKKIEILSSEDSIERFPCISDDGLQIYFNRNNGGNYYTWSATRSSRSVEFGEPFLVSELSPPQSGTRAFFVDFLSPDGTFILGLAYDETGANLRNGDPAIRSRPDPSSVFGPPEYGQFINVSDTSRYERLTGLSSDGLELFFSKGNTTGGIPYRLYRSIRSSTSQVFSVPVLLDQFGAGAGGAGLPRLTPDDRVLFFREGERPSTVLWSAVRSNPGEEFVRAWSYEVGVDNHGYDFTPDLREFYFADGEGIYRAYTNQPSGIPSSHWQNYPR